MTLSAPTSVTEVKDAKNYEKVCQVRQLLFVELLSSWCLKAILQSVRNPYIVKTEIGLYFQNMHFKYYYYVLNKTMSSDWLNTNLT